MGDRRRFLKGVAAAGALAATAPSLLAGCDDAGSAAPKSGADAGGDAAAGADSEASDISRRQPKTYDDKAVLRDGSAGDLPLSAERFPLGVQSGAMRDDEAMLWSFVEVDAADTGYELHVWRPGPTEAQTYVAVQTQVTPEEGYVRQLVTPLLPDTWYSYCLVALGADGPVARSPVGRFRSAFAEGVKKPLHIAGSACTRPPYAPYKALSRMAEAPIDVFCHMGDMVYADGSKSKNAYRGVWKAQLKTKGYRDILTTCGQYRTWDDHELTDNSARYTMPAGLRQDGIDAFFEAGPVPRLDGNRFWDSYRWGATAEFFVLDCRSERVLDSAATPDAEYISKAQMAWLIEALRASPCHFKIVLNSVPIAGLPEIWPFGPDRWQGYPAQRKQLLDVISGDGGQPPVRGVWFLTGDFHLGMLMRLAPEGSGALADIYEVMMGPGGNSNTIVQSVLQDPESGPLFVPKDQFLHVNITPTATRMIFDPEADTVQVVFEHADTGKVLYDQVLPGGGA